jgi:chemotaxis protein CheD
MLIVKQVTKKQTEAIVNTGCITSSFGYGKISTSPLGTCVAVIAYDKTSKIGGIAHIMLPGKSPKEKKVEVNKYAENAIDNLLDEFEALGSRCSNIEICLVGGANVLKKENDTIADDLIFSVFEIVMQRNLRIRRTSLGGFERRTATLFLHSGIVTFKLGDKNEQELFNFISVNTN